jgi:hypothetical protein
MCPACIATATLVLTSAISAGGGRERRARAPAHRTLPHPQGARAYIHIVFCLEIGR